MYEIVYLHLYIFICIGHAQLWKQNSYFYSASKCETIIEIKQTYIKISTSIFDCIEQVTIEVVKSSSLMIEYRF